jgi:hypothetical protein
MLGMLKQFPKILILLSVFILFEKCAQVVPLSGGPRDRKAPELLEAIPENSAIHFNSAMITLRFNEYIQLKDLKNQLTVSPRLLSEPEISVQGKKIVIELKKEELLPNTTYRFNFGKAVADMTEGNAIQGFEYAFSTGSYLDSLQIKGTVRDAFNESPLENTNVGLYIYDKTENDSLVYKNLPDYLAKTDNNGNFVFSKLPPKTYKVLALADKNKNMVYDGESEKIGFRNDLLKLGSDSSVNLHLFSEEPSRQFIKKTIQPYYGKALVLYNKRSKFKVSALREQETALIFETSAQNEKDSIILYYKDIKDSLRLLINDLKSKRTDTLMLALPKLKIGRLKLLNYASNFPSGVLNQGLAPQLIFYNWLDISKTDLRKMQLHYKKDTLELKEQVQGEIIANHIIQINNKLMEGLTYKIKADTASIFDVNGKYNDSLDIYLKLQNKGDLGKAAVKLLLDKKQSYIVQLISEREAVMKEKFISLSLSSSNAVVVDFTDIPPGTYKIKVIFDDNENKRWDTGNFLNNQQAEKVFIASKQIKVLSDWEVEEEIRVK